MTDGEGVKTGFVFDNRYSRHETGAGHPERSARLEAIISHLQKTGILADLQQLPIVDDVIEHIAKIHPPGYIDFIQKACKSGQLYLDSDTVICPDSFKVAMMAVGAVISACDAVECGKVSNAFCAVRPPGHHAEPERAMGFCLFNNVAVAARYLQSDYGRSRIAIVDFDVHHGNGTQAAFYSDESVLFVSLHQHPLYPGTGRESESGKDRGEGYTLNIPLPSGTDNSGYMEVLQEKVLPALDNFRPDFLMISAGFDAHRADPLANMDVTDSGFYEMTSCLSSFAADTCGGRIVSVLEGGYNLEALSASVNEHIRALLGK